MPYESERICAPNEPLYTIINGSRNRLTYAYMKKCASQRRNLILLSRSKGDFRALGDYLKIKHKIQVEYLPLNIMNVKDVRLADLMIQKRGLSVNGIINVIGEDRADFPVNASYENRKVILLRKFRAHLTLLRWFCTDLQANHPSMAVFSPYDGRTMEGYDRALLSYLQMLLQDANGQLKVLLQDSGVEFHNLPLIKFPKKSNEHQIIEKYGVGTLAVYYENFVEDVWSKYNIDSGDFYRNWLGNN